MNKILSVSEVLESLFDNDNEIEEEVSETEDNVEVNSDHEDSSSDEEETSSQPESEVFMSKNGNIEWSPSPHESQGRVPAENIIIMGPGPTQYAITRQRHKVSI